MPSIASEWPAMYFVAECTTTSAPRLSGRCTSGVAKVLSTTMRTPPRGAVTQRSQVGHFQGGFGRGLDPQQRDVVGQGGQHLLGVVDVDEYDLDEPALLQRRQLHQRSLVAVTSSHDSLSGATRSSTLATAAIPEAKANARPPSSCPTADSSDSQVALP
jgi:hypothetical protein